jgi:hypothetical protein
MNNKLIFKRVMLIIICCSMLIYVPVYASAGETQWTKLITERYNDLMYLNNNYILIGSVGDVKDETRTNILKVSKDYKNWTTYDLGKNTYFESILYVKGSYWALTTGYDLYVSKDLKSWEKAGKPNKTGGKLIYTGDNFFIIGKECYYSKDGYKWTKANYTLPVGTPEIGGIEYTKDKGFVVVGRDVFTEVGFSVVSKDGLKWKSNKTNLVQPHKLVWDGKQYVVLSKRNLMVSNDGISWEVIYKFNKDEPISFMRYINNQLIIKRGDEIQSTKDYVDWEKKLYQQSMDMRDVIWDGEKYYGAGVHGELTTSSDGLNWELTNFSNETKYNKIIWAGDKFIAVGNENTVAMSKEGSDWSYKHLNIQVNSKTGSFDIKSISSDGQKYIIVIEYVEEIAIKSEAYVSEDFDNWKKVEYKEFEWSPIEDILYDGQNYIAVGGNSFFSTDAVNWTLIKPRIKGARSIIYAGGKYLIVGNESTVATSSDGKQWSQTKIEEPSQLYNLAYNGKQYIANDYRDSIYTSKDGLVWRQDFSLLPDKKNQYANLRCIAYNDKRSVAVVEITGTYRLYVGAQNGEKVKTVKDSYLKAVIK